MINLEHNYISPTGHESCVTFTMGAASCSTIISWPIVVECAPPDFWFAWQGEYHAAYLAEKKRISEAR